MPPAWSENEYRESGYWEKEAAQQDPVHKIGTRGGANDRFATRELSLHLPENVSAAFTPKKKRKWTHRFNKSNTGNVARNIGHVDDV